MAAVSEHSYRLSWHWSIDRSERRPRSCKDCRKGLGEFSIEAKDPFRWRRVLYISLVRTLRTPDILDEWHPYRPLGSSIIHLSKEEIVKEGKGERKSKPKMSDGKPKESSKGMIPWGKKQLPKFINITVWAGSRLTQTAVCLSIVIKPPFPLFLN